MLLFSNGSHVLVRTLPSYSNSKYRKYFHYKRKENIKLRTNILHQLRRNYFPYLPRSQYKQEEIMHLIPHNLFHYTMLRHNMVLLPTLLTSPIFLLPCYLKNDNDDNDNDVPSFSKDK